MRIDMANTDDPVTVSPLPFETNIQQSVWYYVVFVRKRANDLRAVFWGLKFFRKEWCERQNSKNYAEFRQCLFLFLYFIFCFFVSFFAELTREELNRMSEWKECRWNENGVKQSERICRSQLCISLGTKYFYIFYFVKCYRCWIAKLRNQAAFMLSDN